MKRLIKVISLLLCLVMVISSLPMSAIAAETDNTADTENSNVISVSELEDERDIYSKTYQTSEGTNVVISSAAPLHYENDGELVEIDNTLVKSDDDSSMLTNKSNAYNVELPKKMTEDSEISLDYDGNEISFKLANDDVSKTKASVEETETIDVDETNAESVAYAESNMNNLSSAVTYEGVLENTDIEYVVTPDSLKESIILATVPAEDYAIAYELNLGDLIARLNDDNSVTISDTDGDEIYVIESPYMFDSADNESDDIAVNIEQSERSYVLTYTPNHQWLSESDVVYPVTIDPTIIVKGTYNGLDQNQETQQKEYIEDTYIGNRVQKSQYNKAYLQIQNSSSNNSYAYFNINNIPNVPVGARVKKIKLNFQTSSLLQSNLRLGFYSLNGIENTDFISQLTWNNKPTNNSRLVDYTNVTVGTSSFSFDLTNIGNSLFSNDNNYFLLKADSGNGIIKVASSEATDTKTVPYLSIEFFTNSGLNDEYKYHSQEYGLAGTGYINDFTGDLIIERNEFKSASDPGVTFYMGKNVNSPSSSCLGTNVSINYYQTIEKSPVYDSTYVVTLGDGSQEYYNSTSETCNISETTQTINNEEVITAIELSYNEAETNISEHYSKLDSLLVLTNITKTYERDGDTVSEETEITYSDSGYIESINNSVAYYLFDYRSDSEYALLRFNNIDEAFLYDNNVISYRFNLYRYNANGDKFTIFLGNDENDNDEPRSAYGSETIQYHFDTEGNISNVYTETGRHFDYTYNSFNQVTEVQENIVSQSDGISVSFSYEENSTIISGDNGCYTEYFDSSGLLVSVLDQNGNAVFTKHTDGEPTKTSNVRNSARNIRKFYNFEGESDTFFQSTNGSVSISTENSYEGNSSVKITSVKNNDGSINRFSNTLSDLELNSFYTVAVWLKKPSDLSCNLVLTNSDNNNPHLSSYYIPKQSIETNDWQLISCTIETRYSKNIEVSIDVDNSNYSSVDVYVDNMSVQESPYYTTPNLIMNGDFTNNNSYWIGSSLLIENDNDNSDISTVDSNRLKLVGNMSTNTAVQYVSLTDINTCSGAKFNYGGWAKISNALPYAEGRGVLLSVYGAKYENDVESSVTSEPLGSVQYYSNYSGWQYLEGEITLPEDYGNGCEYNALKVEISFNDQPTDSYAMFDGISLSEGALYVVAKNDNSPAFNLPIDINTSKMGQDGITRKLINRFVYSDDSSLMLGISDSFGNNTTYKYDIFGNLSYVCDAAGKEIEYEYDNFHNLSAVVDSYYQLKENATKDNNTVLYSDNIDKFSERLKVLQNLSKSIDENDQENTFDISENTSYSDVDKTTIRIQYTYSGKRLDEIKTVSSFKTDDTDKTETINEFGFEYDDWGNLVNIFVVQPDNGDKKTFIHFVYDSVNYRQLNSVEYINGQKIKYVYDDKGNVIYEYDVDNSSEDNPNGDSLAYSYYYYPDGTCYAKKDTKFETIETFDDSIISTADSAGKIIQSYRSNDDGSISEQIYNNVVTVSSSKSDDSNITMVNNTEHKIVRTYDDLGRVKSEKVLIGGNSEYPYILKEYSYYAHGKNGTDDIDFAEHNDDTIETSDGLRYVSYYYVTQVQDENNEVQISKVDISQFRNLYWFNRDVLFSTVSNNWSDGNDDYASPQGYLTNNANMILYSEAVFNGYKSRYRYDLHGNIENVSESIIDGNSILSNNHSSGNYKYSFEYDKQNSGTKLGDHLTTFTKTAVHSNGDECIFTKNYKYDPMGNTSQISTLNGDNTSTLKFSWKRGNILDSVSFGENSNLSFSYDNNNLRKIKEFNSAQSYSKTEYFWDNNRLIGQSMHFDENNSDSYYNSIVLYDANNQAYGFVLNEYDDETYQNQISTNTYFYVKDAQNTIQKIIDAQGNLVIRYTYNDFGVPSVTYGSNQEVAETILKANPLIYRDYIYDQETGLYYLISRYYNPEVGRYISANNCLDTGSGTIMATNLYAYCENDPINNVDYDGMFKVSSFKEQLRFDSSVVCAKDGVYFGKTGIDNYYQKQYR